MTARWWKRLWLRYLHYSKHHWLMAGTLTLWVVWFVLQILIQLLPLLFEMLIAAV